MIETSPASVPQLSQSTWLTTFKIRNVSETAWTLVEITSARNWASWVKADGTSAAIANTTGPVQTSSPTETAPRANPGAKVAQGESPRSTISRDKITSVMIK